MEMLKKTPIIPIMFLLAFTILASPAAAGQISGRVKPQGLRSSAGILVYLVKAPAPKLNFAKTTVELDQRKLSFIPHILPVLVGTEVDFPNNDQVAHNVFSLSQAKKFNLGSYGPGQKKTIKFDTPGVIDLRCDVHQEMNAFIMVLKNPYFTKTDSGGNFTIPDIDILKKQGLTGVAPLPPGKYVIKTWHEKLRTSKITVNVANESRISVELKPKRGAPGVLYK